jgi:hypothetical protein
MAFIPKNVHIIWIGGALPEKNQACVDSFHALNPDWTINLWFDPDALLGKYRHIIQAEAMRQFDGTKDLDIKAAGKASAATALAKTLTAKAKKKGSFDEAIVSYIAHNSSKTFGGKKSAVDEYKRVLRATKDENLKALQDYAAKGTIQLKSVEEFGYGPKSPYTVEMQRRGNFGALSDIVRIDAILKYGGVYFDTDVECKEPLGSIDVPNNLGRFSCTHTGMKVQLLATGRIAKTDWLSDKWWSDKITGGPPDLVNSIIAAHPNSDMLKSYRNHISNNYREVRKGTVDWRSFYPGVRRDVISRTGPGTLVNTARENPQFSYAEDLDYKKWLRDTLIFPMYIVEDKFFHDWI